MINLPKKLKSLRKDNDGAAAVEAAIVFPILICCLFGVVGIGTYLFGTHQAQRTVEETAREARVYHAPTEADLVGLLNSNMKSPMFGSYEPAVALISQFDGEYAELTVTYNFKFDFPFLDLLNLQSTSSTQVKIRQMPI